MLRRTHRKMGWILAPVFFLLAFSNTAFAADDDEAIEEVVVTGSYLKKTTADSPSPLSVVSRADIEEMGAVDIKDIVSNLTYNSGSISNSTPFYGGDNSQGNVSLNLRNLGNGSTLVLLNGRRNVTTDFDNVGNGYVDVSGLVPTIAIERLEIVKDGSSALYGSDAIAGVVNFITRDNFEGFDLQVEYATDDETKKQDDAQVSAIFGISGDRGNVVVAASYLDRSGLQIGDRFETFGQSGLSSFGQPGRYIPLGATPADPTSFFVPGGSASFGQQADPDCDLAAADDGPKGVIGNVGGQCIYDFSSFFHLVSPQKQSKVFARANFSVTDTVEIWGEANFSDNEINRGNSLFPDVSFAIIPATNPGLMLDAERRGVQAPAGGYLALQRLLGGHNDTPFADRPVDTESTFDRQFYRFATGLTADLMFGEKAWTLDVSAARSERNANSVTPSDTLTRNTDAAYEGLGGPDCDPLNGTPGSGNAGTGNCYYYNPFQTSRYDPVTGARWDTSDTSPWAANPSLTVAEAAQQYQNPDFLYQWIAGEIQTDTQATLDVFDIVLAGDMFETDNGAVGVAIGAQRRKESIRVNNDKNLNDNNYKFVYGAIDWEGELTTTAVFVEIFVPLTEWAELTVAGRYEDFKELGVDTVDPKATLMIRPTESLTLRASAGTSFRVGSLLQLFGSSTTLLNSSDSFSGAGGLAFRPSITTGNSELQPEEATAFNIGLSWAPVDGPLEGLSVDIDYFDYEYDDIITREAHQALINADNASRCPNGVNLDPMAGPVCGATGGSFTSIGPGLPDKVIRDASGNLLRTQASYLNAQSLNATGVDLNINYTFEAGDAGTFRAGLNASWMREYDLVDPNGVEIDGVGSRNQANSVGHPLPEYKANLILGWTRDRHAANVTVRWIDEYEDDVPQSQLRGSFIGFAPTIDDMTTVDAQYSVQLPALDFQSEGATLTFGVKNLFNEEPPLLNNDGAYDPFTHDPRGRIWYGRLLFSL